MGFGLWGLVCGDPGTGPCISPWMLQAWSRVIALLLAVLVTKPHFAWGLGEPWDLSDPLADTENSFLEEVFWGWTYGGEETHRSASAHGKVSCCMTGKVVT